MTAFSLSLTSHDSAFHRDFKNLYKTDVSELTLVNKVIIRPLLSQISTKSEDLIISLITFFTVFFFYDLLADQWELWELYKLSLSDSQMSTESESFIDSQSSHIETLTLSICRWVLRAEILYSQKV